MSGNSSRRQVCAGLAKAVLGTDLDLCIYADLDGASVRGPVVEAYVIAVSSNDFQVEMWRAADREPYRVQPCNDLDEAIIVAVDAARGG